MPSAARSGFKSKTAIGSGQKEPNRKHTTDYTLREQVRQQGTGGSIPSQVWNTYSLPRDAHKPTGESCLSGVLSAFRVLLAGSPDQTTHTHEHNHNGGRTDA